MVDLIHGERDNTFVIIGGGILGMGVATLAAISDVEPIAKPIVIRRSDVGRPRADTLRNQSWLQSGLLYKNGDFVNDEHRIRVANATYAAGQVMVGALGLSLTEERGVLRVKGDVPLKRLQEKLSELDIPHEKVNELLPAKAEQIAGDLYEADSKYFTLPDTPFDEAAVMRALRTKASAWGAVFAISDSPVVLAPSKQSPSGVQVRIGGEILEPSVLLLTAGAGTATLLAPLGIDLGIGLRQTPLLVCHDRIRMSAVIYVDFDHGFSIVRQSDTVVTPNGALIVGTGKHRVNAQFALPENRTVTKQEVAAFRGSLPEKFQWIVDKGRFTAGFEVMPNATSGISFLEAWDKSDFEDYPGLIVACPGRATLGWQTSFDVMDIVRKKLVQLGASTNSLQLSPWTDEIHMHFDRSYSFDDAEPRGASQ